MPVRPTSIVFNAVDVDTLAYFWSSNVDGWALQTLSGGEVRLTPDEEDGSTLDLVFSPAQPRVKTGKNRIHLDLNTDSPLTYQADREAFPLMGATLVDVGQGELVPWTVCADPEGNEFCLLKPRDRYFESGALAAVVVDCADPDLLARFWSAATGWEVVENEPDFVALRAPGVPPRGPFLEFCRVADRHSEPSPVTLAFESYWAHQHDADVAGLLELGARRVREHEGEVSYSVLADPEGNEFRVVVPVWPPRPPVKRKLEPQPSWMS